MAARTIALAVVAVLVVTAAPLDASARSDRAVRVGVLRPAPDGPVFRQMFEPFRETLRERGFVEGTNLTIELRVQPGGAAEMLELARQLVPLNVDPAATVNGVRLFYQLGGNGDVPLVLVHGSWGSHHGWDLVAPGLGKSFRVLAYDRRGHSQSERPTVQGSVREDVADLAALIEYLGLAPAWVAGSSFGASIALRLAGERPALLTLGIRARRSSRR